eukprot:m.174541 g.174541  ORF g.174541 m.174541 type:complete len:527 (-) comp31771_c0_seq8:160-1740(-)
MDDYMEVGPAVTTSSLSLKQKDCHTLDNLTSQNDAAPEYMDILPINTPNDTKNADPLHVAEPHVQPHPTVSNKSTKKQPCSSCFTAKPSCCFKVTAAIVTTLIVIVVVVISILVSRRRATPSNYGSSWPDPGSFSSIPTHADCLPGSESAADECTSGDDCGIVCASRSGWGAYYPICHCGTAYTPTRYYNNFYCPERTTTASTSTISSTETNESSSSETSSTPHITTPTREYGGYVAHAMCCCENEDAEVMLGRPFIVNRVSRTAQTQTLVSSDSEWSDDCSIDRFLNDTQLNNKLGEYWANVGAAEHASVGSFLRFGLHLLSIGAPPFLLTLVHEASLDEIKHAQMTYGLASAYFGYDVGPSKLDISNSLDNNSLLHILMSVIEEGCVGETISAVEAKMGSPLALDTKVAEVLQTIADDEAKHAHLAWQFLAWAVTSSSLENAHSIVEQNFAKFLSPTHSSHTPIVVSQHDRDVRRHGVLTADDRRQIRIATINTVIRPALVAVLAGKDANVAKRISSMELELIV